MQCGGVAKVERYTVVNVHFKHVHLKYYEEDGGLQWISGRSFVW